MAWLTGWTYRQKLGINGDAYIGSNITDFTVSVNAPSSNTDFWVNVLSSGNDVRFTAADGSTLLKFEIESFDSTGDDAWYNVKVPTLSSSVNTDIYLYYGNAGAAAGDDKENSVDASHVAVYRLNADKAEGYLDDTTSKNHDLTNSGTIAGTTAMVDNGRDFDGVDDYMVEPKSPDWDFGAGDFYYACSFNSDSFANNNIILALGKEGAGIRSLLLGTNSSGQLRFWWSQDGQSAWDLSSAGSSGALSANTTYRLALRRSGNTFYMYIDAVQKDSFDVTSYPTLKHAGNCDICIGNVRNSGGSGVAHFDGTIDDVILISGSRSVDFVKADHQSALGAWLIFGSQETEGGSGAAIFTRHIMQLHDN